MHCVRSARFAVAFSRAVFASLARQQRRKICEMMRPFDLIG
jgi:hypothetical protein